MLVLRSSQSAWLSGPAALIPTLLSEKVIPTLLSETVTLCKIRRAVLPAVFILSFYFYLCLFQYLCSSIYG